MWVPQASVLGPLLFLLFINDLFLSSNYLSFILFADDTNIFLRHKDLATLTRMINQELSHVSSWFNANKLTVHPDKSKFIIFHPRRKQINPSELNTLINNTPIVTSSGHLHMPPTLNPTIYSKRKPFELSPFFLQELVLSLFFSFSFQLA